MKRITMLTIAVLLGGVLVGFLAKHAKTQVRESRPNYTINFNWHVLNTKTAYVKEDFFIKALRDGTDYVRINYHAHNGLPEEKPYSSEMWLSSTNRYVWLHHSGQYRSTEPREPGKLANLLTVLDPTCKTRAGYVYVGETDFLGVPVVILRQERNDQIHAVRVRWDAPDCNCEYLYERTEAFDDHGSVSVVDSRIAVALSFEKPRDGLYFIPSDYREVPPSTIMSLMWSRAGITGLPNMLVGMDDRYYRAQIYK